MFLLMISDSKTWGNDDFSKQGLNLLCSPYICLLSPMYSGIQMVTQHLFFIFLLSLQPIALLQCIVHEVKRMVFALLKY